MNGMGCFEIGCSRCDNFQQYLRPVCYFLNCFMAHPTPELINALRETAARLRKGAYYAWGHHGGCNCGNLVQVVCDLNKEQIVAMAHESSGEWTEIAQESCSVTFLPLRQLLQRLEAIGLTPTDVHHLEYLDDVSVLKFLPGGFRWLKRNRREDVISYFEAMADQLEERLLQSVRVDVRSLLQEPVLAM
jgi:hypothetical protein